MKETPAASGVSFGYVTVACGTGLSISCLYVQQKQSLEACDESA